MSLSKIPCALALASIFCIIGLQADAAEATTQPVNDFAGQIFPMARPGASASAPENQPRRSMFIKARSSSARPARLAQRHSREHSATRTPSCNSATAEAGETSASTRHNDAAPCATRRYIPSACGRSGPVSTGANVSVTPYSGSTQGVACGSNGAISQNGNSFITCTSGAWSVNPGRSAQHRARLTHVAAPIRA